MTRSVRSLFLLLMPAAAFGQQAPALRADLFTVDAQTYLFATGVPGTSVATYSQPGGGRQLQHADLDAKGILRLPAEGQPAPAFALLRQPDGSGATVCHFSEPEFTLTEPALTTVGTARILSWRCVERPGAHVAVQIWRRADGGAALLQKTVSPGPASQSFSEEPGTAQSVSYQLRVVGDDGVVRWQSDLGEPAPAALRLYPNPATDVLHLDVPQGADAVAVEVMDAQGRLVVSAPVRGSQPSLSLKSLPPGLYTVRVRNATAVVGTGQVVKR